ncbi:hypothetical protein GIB67_001096, partial [Kingdonia uniflora]
SSSLAHLGSNLGLGDPRLLFTSVVVGGADFGHGERLCYPRLSPFLVVIPCRAHPSSFRCRFVVVIDFWKIGFRWWWCL